MKILGLTIGKTPEPEEKAIALGSGMVELFDRRGLTTYKTVSERLIHANMAWVYANVSAIANEVSKLTPLLHRVRIVKGQVEFEPILSHPILDLLDRFNDFTTASEAFFLTESHIELAGDTFYLLDGSGINIRNLFILAPDKVTLNIGEAADSYRVTSYTFKDTVDGKTTEVTYPAEQIIHIKEPNPGNPYRGKSVVEAAAGVIDTDNLSREWIKQFFRNAARPDFVLWTDKSLSKDTMQRLETEMNRKFRGPANAGRTMILEGGLQPKELQFTNKDMEFLGLRESTRDEIMAMFKNTKVSLGIVEDVNRASAEESMATWKQSVIKPKMARIIDALNEFLVPRYGSNLILTFEDPVPENREAKVDEIVKLKKEANVITVNEARRELGLEPIEGEEFDNIRSSAGPIELAMQVPKVIQNVNYQRVLRRNKIYELAEAENQAWEVAKSIAKRQLKSSRKPKQKEATRESAYFTNEMVWSYWAKQIKLSEIVEQRFLSRVQQFLTGLENKALSNLAEVKPKQLKKKQFELFDKDTEVSVAIDLLEPLLKEAALLAGEQAYALIDMDATYTITNRLRHYVERQTAQLAETFISTDVDKLNQILVDGIESGEGIPAIERRIRQEFGDFTKVQSTRIARTEVLRAANAGAIDAFEESGIVEAKQWLTAEDDRVDPVCAALNGKIIGLRKRYFDDDYLSGQEPPIHPNCRCVVIPVLKDLKAYEIDRLKQELAKLEDELVQTKEYTTELEKVAGVSNDSGS